MVTNGVTDMTSKNKTIFRKNDNCDWAEITFGSIDSVTYAISGLRGQRLPGSERRCRVDYAFTQEGAEKIGTFSSLSAYHERRARESGSMRELHSALGDCWEGSFEVKKNPIPCRLSLIGIFHKNSDRAIGLPKFPKVFPFLVRPTGKSVLFRSKVT